MRHEILFARQERRLTEILHSAETAQEWVVLLYVNGVKFLALQVGLRDVLRWMSWIRNNRALPSASYLTTICSELAFE